VLSDLSVSRWLQGSWKLARSTATSNILVLHRVSDVLGVGDRGDATVALAAGLLADSGTSVCFQLGTEDAADAGEILGHGSTEIGLLPTLGRGVALWRISGEAHLVRHHVHDHEREVIDSDRAMRR
ncbi:MAG: ATP-binding protein, partial [Actinomycetota bacterium]